MQQQQQQRHHKQQMHSDNRNCMRKNIIINLLIFFVSCVHSLTKWLQCCKLCTLLCLRNTLFIVWAQLHYNKRTYLTLTYEYFANVLTSCHSAIHLLLLLFLKTNIAYSASERWGECKRSTEKKNMSNKVSRIIIITIIIFANHIHYNFLAVVCNFYPTILIFNIFSLLFFPLQKRKYKKMSPYLKR